MPAGDGPEPGRGACLPGPAFPDSAFSSGRCSFPGQVEQGLCVTPAKLLLFPEVVFKAEKESGQGPCFS